jgi:hypothetical protein
LATYTLQSPPHAGAQLTFTEPPASGDLVTPGQGYGLLVINPTGNGSVTVSLPMPTSDGVTVGPRVVTCAAATATPTLIPLPSSVYGTAPIALTYTGTLTTVQVAYITIP